MAQRRAADGWDRPSVVQVTVVPGPHRGIGGARAGGLARRGAASLVVAGAAVCALLAGGGIPMLHRGAARPTTTAPARAVAVAVPLSAATQAYRFPLGCLRITHTREALAGAVRRRTDPCWRYGVYVTAILKRVGGTWRLALVASGGSCSRSALPALVRAQLSVCRR